MLPDSITVISALLRPARSREDAEVHFSLFTCLDEVSPGPQHRATREAVLQLLERYLVNVRSDVAHAAWMAGDLLGDHWPAAESIPVLIRVSAGAHYPAGRKGALHGLSYAVERAPKRMQWEIRKTIKRVADADQSRRIRQYAQMCLDGPLAR